MENKVEQCSVWQSIALHYRGVKQIHRMYPGCFPSLILHSLCKALVPYVTIFFSARIIDELATQRRPEMLNRLVLLSLLISSVLGLLVYLMERWKAVEESKFHAASRYLMTEKFFTMDFAAVDDRKNLDLYSQIQQNSSWGDWGFEKLYRYCQQMIDGAVGCIGAAVLMKGLFSSHVTVEGSMKLLDSPLSVAALFGVMALLLFLAAWLMNKVNRFWLGLAEHSRLGNRICGTYMDFGYGTKSHGDIRMYRHFEIGQYYMKNNRTFGVGSPFAKLQQGKCGICIATAIAMPTLFTGAVYLFVCLKAWAGAFGIGAVSQYVGAVTALAANLGAFAITLGEMRSNAGFLKLIYEFLDIPNDMYQGSLTTEKRSDREYQVEFKNVSFKYPGSEVWALKNVNMKFRVGKRLAIVGENGSGKTTFIKLLCRLYDPQEGQILLNGIDIRKYNYRDYMDIFSIVFQDFQLISQPLGNNVSGSMTYDPERVKKALTDAGFGDRLTQLPEGLHTQLYKDFGVGGVDVSGGEAQKIAIARALYRDAPFIILDEPTAALDPVAEAEIYAKFNDISGDKTAIYISHRLSSCKFCDEIAVFDGGQVIQQGTHEALLKDKAGKYAALWNAQAQYYTEKE